MYPYYPYMYYGVPALPVNSFRSQPYFYPNQPHHPYRQQPINGQVTWTEGGDVTKCDIPWSENEYMTAAVGEDSPYQCGQLLKIRNVAAPYGREIIVMIVDEVAGFPPNRVNVHRKAFEALGVNPNIGVLNVEIIPTPELEQEKWGKYLLEVTQTAYPNYQITDYRTIGKTKVSDSQMKETYEFSLQSYQEMIKVRGTVIYNPNTDRIVSFDIKEM
ncbi:DUF3889 domain-containing protein [Oceanobacillus halophilus]|uniref:DUF3889 domain-containing protein n=1 Tax=Oceanobacillus halophilus TaxID=930130 RepID=A0A495A3E2_9BACI|nr:DUF3889 domain-containing protein [Oceanobacillus halophilus]RKQ33899.1 DUF3889 domain-containing protein [Oceanobacillus halophilus]